MLRLFLVLFSPAWISWLFLQGLMLLWSKISCTWKARAMKGIEMHKGRCKMSIAWQGARNIEHQRRSRGRKLEFCFRWSASQCNFQKLVALGPWGTGGGRHKIYPNPSRGLVGLVGTGTSTHESTGAGPSGPSAEQQPLLGRTGLPCASSNLLFDQF